MNRLLNIAIVGATGATGQELLRLLETRGFPVDSLRCFASLRSCGQNLLFRGHPVVVEPLQEGVFSQIDLAFFCADSQIAKIWAPQAVQEGAIVIDKSSQYRLDPQVPLIIPEINSNKLFDHQGIIASPNCTATIMLMVLAPLHRAFGAKRVAVTTYQAASGAGQQAMEELKEESRAFLEERPFVRTVVPFPYAFNVFPHDSSFGENGYADEEMKMMVESLKILEDDRLKITATCVRVPTLRAHAEAINIEFEQAVTPEMAYEVLKGAPGVRHLEERLQNRFPMPIDAIGVEEVLYGRIRSDQSRQHTLDIWVVGDQLLKGASLNAIQIAESLYNSPYAKFQPIGRRQSLGVEFPKRGQY